MSLQQKIQMCEIHLQRLNMAFGRIKQHYPFQKQMFPLESDDEIAYLDLFTGRFSKLQDAMGEKVFPAILEIVGNRSQALTYIDILNALEKNHILVSAARWRKLRDLRNKLAHEYPDCAEEQCRTLNEIVQNFTYLEETLNAIKLAWKKNEHSS